MGGQLALSRLYPFNLPSVLTFYNLPNNKESE